MELLILKSKEDYIRFTDGAYHKVGMEKASVFPMARLEEVQTHEARLKEQGIAPVQIKKLVITEKDI